ncbi:MAG TPA: D-2-hydroxyacid dehydrogenase [Caldilineaceae bacterium]|nr:D-2-hydroxyacid dehydrogenase [Caldilineaceae bacterium]
MTASSDVLLFMLPPDWYTPDDLEAVRRTAPELEVMVENERERILALLPRIVVGVGHVPFDLLAEMPRLRWVQLWHAGADAILSYPAAQAHPFVLTNASGVHAVPISEHILSLLLAFARGLPKAFKAQQARRWESPDWEEVFELEGKTLLLVGVGAIGARTAQVAATLGVRVLGVRRHPEQPAPGVAAMYPPDALHELLPQADFVALTLPLTPETKGIIGAAELALMKPTAYILNIGRGAAIDEPALIEALRAGRIGGAGLDVFAEEPLPPDSPLWAMENVIITCHYAGKTPVYDQRAMAILLDNLERFRQGLPLRNVVDKMLGY